MVVQRTTAGGATYYFLASVLFLPDEVADLSLFRLFRSLVEKPAQKSAENNVNDYGLRIHMVKVNDITLTVRADHAAHHPTS